MRSRRWTMTLTGSLGPLLLAFVWIETQRSRAEAPVSDPPPGSRPAMVLEQHVERIRTRRGEVSWQFQGRRVEILDSGDYLIRGLERGRYYSNDVVEVEFSGDLARFEARTHNIAARGNLVVWSRRGLTFRTDALYHFESEGKLVARRVEDLQWRDPTRPETPPGTIRTERLFFWPRDQRLVLPDPLEARFGPHTVTAASATGQLVTARLELAGPAKVTALAGTAAATGGGPAARRVVLGVQRGGVMAFNGRTGGTLLQGGVTVNLPSDRLDARCQTAVYSGEPQRTIRATGQVTVTVGADLLQAPAAIVDTRARRVDCAGPVRLTHTGVGQVLDLQAPRLSFWYASGGRRLVASGGVKLGAGAVVGTCDRLSADLEREVADLTGSVVLHHTPRGTPRPGAGEVERARFEPVTLRCGRLRHRFAMGSRSSAASGSPRFSQAAREGSADRLTFDHEAEILTLTGRVRARNRDGEQARCARLVYDVSRDEMQVEAPLTAEFFLREER